MTGVFLGLLRAAAGLALGPFKTGCGSLRGWLRAASGPRTSIR